jgi:hypothetical protein
MFAPLIAACFLFVAPPKVAAKLGVVELVDENLGEIIDQILAGNVKAVDLKVERADVFTGLESIKQTGNERHVNNLKGWAYKIVETPKAADEFRYLRFAWRKEGGGSILIAFATNGGQWSGKRYAAGPYALGGSGYTIAHVAPTEWTVVTRDLFKDFGELSLSSVLFSSSNGGTAYFDHILLGQTVEDLDRATATALGKSKPKEPLVGKVRDALWADLVGDDKVKAMAAFRAFLAVAPEQVSYIREKLPQPSIEADKLARIQKLLKQLRSEDFDERIAATEQLKEIGTIAVPHLQAEAEREDSPESQYRAKLILKKLGVKAGELPPALVRAARIVRLLERAGTKDAKELLDKLGEGVYGNGYTVEARAAQLRLKGPK